MYFTWLFLLFENGIKKRCNILATILKRIRNGYVSLNETQSLLKPAIINIYQQKN